MFQNKLYVLGRRTAHGRFTSDITKSNALQAELLPRTIDKVNSGGQAGKRNLLSLLDYVWPLLAISVRRLIYRGLKIDINFLDTSNIVIS